jgi:predicted metalloprotease
MSCMSFGQIKAEGAICRIEKCMPLTDSEIEDRKRRKGIKQSSRNSSNDI